MSTSRIMINGFEIEIEDSPRSLEGFKIALAGEVIGNVLNIMPQRYLAYFGEGETEQLVGEYNSLISAAEAIIENRWAAMGIQIDYNRRQEDLPKRFYLFVCHDGNEQIEQVTNAIVVAQGIEQAISKLPRKQIDGVTTSIENVNLLQSWVENDVPQHRNYLLSDVYELFALADARATKGSKRAAFIV